MYIRTLTICRITTRLRKVTYYFKNLAIDSRKVAVMRSMQCCGILKFEARIGDGGPVRGRRRVLVLSAVHGNVE